MHHVKWSYGPGIAAGYIYVNRYDNSPEAKATTDSNDFQAW